MPAKNSRKIYKDNAFYHIYNRGVEKRVIFLDKQDYGVFLSYVKDYLSNKDNDVLREKINDPKIPWTEKDRYLKLLRLNNFFGQMRLLTYCLMPNHFHFLIWQKKANNIDVFMNSLSTRYVMYFNKKYKRVGPLYQGIYKAVLVKSEEQLLHLSAYIHKNSRPEGHALKSLLGQPSSLPDYLRQRNTVWVNTDIVLSYFSKTNKNTSYENFVLDSNVIDPLITKVTLDQA